MKTDQLFESMQLSEEAFILALKWMKARSGSEVKAELGDKLKKEFPGLEPWKWSKAPLVLSMY